MIALPPETKSSYYSWPTTASNCGWCDCDCCDVDPVKITVEIHGAGVPEQQAEEPEHPRLRPPAPRRSSRPPAARLDFARRPVNRHPSARRAFRY